MKKKCSMKRENIEMSSPFVIEILINFLVDTFDNINWMLLLQTSLLCIPKEVF